MKKLIISSIVFSFSISTFADPSPAKKWTHKNSQCEVRTKGGENPVLEVIKSKKVVYSPDCDCGIQPTFSPSGKYIAFTNSEMDFFKVNSGAREFRLVIYNCENGKFKGFLKGQSTSPGKGYGFSANWVTLKSWAKDEKSIKLSEGPVSGNSKELTLNFIDENALP
ncbi:MAG: hypothetical protein AB7I27_14845 [Bacteriovoracaceae bacterium]